MGQCSPIELKSSVLYTNERSSDSARRIFTPVADSGVEDVPCGVFRGIGFDRRLMGRRSILVLTRTIGQTVLIGPDVSLTLIIETYVSG